MSDTYQAPAPSAPPAPPPQAEVPVNETPINQPSPLGEQAPPKPPGQDSNKSSHIGRREAIENAFAKARQAQDEAAKEAPKRARPGMGHNQPPEPMEKEKQPETQAEKAQRYREGGRFARDPAKAAASQATSGDIPRQVATEQQPQQIQPLHKDAPYREPPGRFADNAKIEWHTTPETVRGAVHQMAREFQGAYEKFRGDYEVMEQLRPYHDLAVKQGTSLRRAFDNYYNMEVKLRSDLIGGLDVLVQNLARSQNLRKSDGSLLNLQDVAQHILSMSPEQHQLSQQRNQQTSTEMRIGQLHQQVDQLSQGISQMIYQQRFTATRADVDRFAQTHPRFDELGDLIKSELDLGFPLEVAYRRAEMLRPAHAAQTRTHSAQTRKTSISGAPDGGNTSPSDGRRSARNGEAKHPSRREAIAKAMRRVGNGL